MRVVFDQDVIALVDEQGAVVHRFVRNDPVFNASLMDVIANDPVLLGMYNDLVLAAQMTKVAHCVKAAEVDILDVRALFDNVAFNDTTAAVLKARLH